MKKRILTTTLIAAIAIGTAVTASANWGQRGGGYWNNNMPTQAPGPRVQMQYQQLDPAAQEKLDKFFADTQDLHKQIITKRAEERALMSGANPDPAAVSKLAGEIFDLRSTLRQKAEEAGVTAYLGPYGPRSAMNFGPGGNGMRGANKGGRYMNDMQNGFGSRGRWN